MEDRNPYPSAFEATFSEREINPISSLAMTSASASTSAPRQHKFDKENVHHHPRQQPAASLTGRSRSPKTVPIKAMPLTQITATFRALSPINTPSLLPQNLVSQMSLMTTDSPGRRRMSETPTRMMDQGASRIINQVLPGSGTPLNSRRRVVKCRRLRSTKSGSPNSQGGSPDQSFASSSSLKHQQQDSLYQDAQNTSQWSETSSVYSLAAEMSMDITPTRPSPTERAECVNPVAFTLWRGGHEDQEWLQEQDRIVAVPRYPAWRQAFSPSPSNSSVTSSSSGRIPPPLPPRVSSNLRDVYGANYSCEISRPIPMMARRKDDFYY